jgi:hypothetical protein
MRRLIDDARPGYTFMVRTWFIYVIEYHSPQLHRLLSTLHISFIAIALYHYLIDNFTNVLALLIPFWSICLIILLSGMADAVYRSLPVLPPFRLLRMTNHALQTMVALSVSP